MSRLVMDPRSRFGFEANFNPSLRMSTGAMASVKFKLDKEKAKYEKTIRVLNLSEKVEMRIAQKQVEDVKKELTLIRAYQHVAKQMAFKNFDPVIRRRRERRERERREDEEAAIRRRQQRLQQQLDDEDDDDDDNDDDDDVVSEESRRLSASGNVFVTLKDIMGNDEVLRRNSREINAQRRKSQASLEFLDYGGGEDEDEDFVDGRGRMRRRRKSDVLCDGQILRSPRRGSVVSGDDFGDGGKLNGDDVVEVGGGKGSVERSRGGLLGVEKMAEQRRRRRSRAGSLGIVGLDSIEENGCEGGSPEKGRDMSEEVGKSQRSGSSSTGNKASSLVVSGRKGFKTTGNVVKGFFLTSTDESEDKTKKKSKRNERGINDNREKPMSIYQISKFYEKQRSQHMEENKSKELNHQKRLERRKYESLRRRVQKEKNDKNNNRSSAKSSDTTKAVAASDERTPVTDESLDSQKLSTHEKPQSTPSTILTEDVESKNKTTTIPIIIEEEHPSDGHDTANTAVDTTQQESSEPQPTSPLKGLARFKNAATAVSVQLMVSNPKKSRSSRLKNIAAAVMMKENPTNTGRVPQAFMYSDAFAERFGRERDKSKATTLEASHRKPEDCKIRPLPMPESVKADYTEKWTSLMGNINSAVRWKVRALREDTGTVNSRQLRRQAREEQPSVTSSVSPRSPRNPPRSVFPGACKTTWAVKKFFSQEIDDVLKAWHPENIRRKRNQKMKDKVTLPQFIDRARTTTSILNSFRSYCKVKGGGENEEEEEAAAEGGGGGNDDDDDSVEKEDDGDDDIGRSGLRDGDDDDCEGGGRIVGEEIMV